jgi:hypothetical protein
MSHKSYTLKHKSSIKQRHLFIYNCTTGFLNSGLNLNAGVLTGRVHFCTVQRKKHCQKVPG